jgi:group I intron endonuclease
VLVYLITNQLNGKVYVGQTKSTLQQRWRQHCDSAKCGDPWYLQRAIRKYGQPSFKIELLCAALSQEELDFLEILFIQVFHSTDAFWGYNEREGGSGGGGPSLAVRKRMSEMRKGFPAWNKGLPSGRKGIKNSLEHNRNIAKAKTGVKRKPFSAEWCRKISEANKGRLNPKVSECMKGFKHSEQSKTLMSEVKKQQYENVEYRRKVSIGVTEMWKDPEERKKRSEAMKLAWINRKERNATKTQTHA